MTEFARVNDIVINRDKVLFVWHMPGDATVVEIVFDGDVRHQFRGPEAADVWRLFDDERDWRSSE